LYKKLKVCSSILLIILSLGSICCGTIKSKIIQTSTQSLAAETVRLAIDSLKYEDMTRNFRRSSDITNVEKDKSVNIEGLNSLNISGSQQFSSFNISSVINNIDTKLPIIVIDLRQESHGFINGIPVSWKNAKNDANIGLTREQVILDENSKLESIKLNTPITLYNNSERTIIPTKVENENQLVSSKSLSYIRIPVTDGKTPTADMVDYFVEVVKSQPENTWLHFHCKEGIGRTATFMIMYDIIKNYKQVKVEDIIKRQLLLANFSEENTKSFYNPERIGFIENFYKYCKENGDKFNIKWSDWHKISNSTSNTFSSVTPICKNTSNYMKNPQIPTFLYVISQDKMTSSERTMIACLQGVVNNHCSSQIYTLSSSQPDYQIWLDDLKNTGNISYEIISDPWELFDIFKNHIDGYVLYNNKKHMDPSINNACSLAALNNCIAIDQSIEDKIKLHGITKMKGDCRNTDKAWAYNNLWNCGLNHSTVIEISPNKDSALRDYAIMSKSLIFYDDNIKDVSFRGKVFSSMEDNATCLGWGPDEFTNVSTASKYGVSIVAADWSYNLTVLSAFPSVPIVQKASIGIPEEKDVHYVTFIISDGDNQQWYLGNNYSSHKWYGSPYRGKLNLGWSISPSLYYLAPTVFNLYYNNASNGTYNDYFIVSPSGNGYMYPSKFNKDKLGMYINRLNSYMKEVDEKYVAIIDDSSFYNTKLWNKFTSQSNINGLFYLDYKRHDNYQGKILWSNNKPVVSCRDLLWSGLEDEVKLVKKINNRVELGQVDIHDSSAYTFVYVHAWSKDLSDIENVKKLLEKNPKVRIVSPKDFMELIIKNIN